MQYALIAAIVVLVLALLFVLSLLNLQCDRYDRSIVRWMEALQKKDEEVRALTESYLREQGKPYIPSPTVEKVRPPIPTPRAFAMRPNPPVTPVTKG